MKNDKTLKRWFREYNRKYFDNTLPDSYVFWEPSFVTSDDWGELWEKEPGLFVIRIDPATKFCRELSRVILLHELVHLKLWPYMGHDKRFQTEIARLIFLGAYKSLL